MARLAYIAVLVVVCFFIAKFVIGAIFPVLFFAAGVGVGWFVRGARGDATVERLMRRSVPRRF